MSHSSSYSDPDFRDIRLIDLRAEAPAIKPGDYAVAKRVTTSDGATIVVFRFGPEQRLLEHHAPHAITVQTIEGAVDFTIGNRTEELQPGTVLYVPAGIKHSVQSKHGAIMQLILHTGDQGGFDGHPE
ncbi:cupin domain-containing protein [Corynebacterium sp. H113]|uniref:cupin domain-containing protein n=1 Tax=Corynebacterium sp. H113 TaxID=3133419 RepID=UPI0030AF8BE6